MAATALEPVPTPWNVRIAAAFRPPELPDASRKAFRFHMAYVLLDSVSSGIVSNIPLMAVKALQASDAQLQIPIAMTSAGLFASVITGAVMARKRKLPFMLVPGFVGASFMFLMAWTRTPLWFLIAAGVVAYAVNHLLKPQGWAATTEKAQPAA